MNTKVALQSNQLVRATLLASLSFALVSLAGSGSAYADGINTNNALTPASGQLILRVQFRTTSLAGQEPDFGVTKYAAPFLVAYGINEKIALIAVAPALGLLGYSPGPNGREKIKEYGIGDARLLAKARLFSHDAVGKTARIAMIAGLQLPSKDSVFSSDSFDPIAGASISLKSLDRNLDIDATYKLSTSDGDDDIIRYNVALTQMLIQGQSLDDSFWQWNAILEVNSQSTTGGQHSVNMSPGMQLALPELIIEASISAPIIRPSGPGPSPTSSYVVGIRRFW